MTGDRNGSTVKRTSSVQSVSRPVTGRYVGRSGLCIIRASPDGSPAICHLTFCIPRKAREHLLSTTNTTTATSMKQLRSLRVRYPSCPASWPSFIPQHDHIGNRPTSKNRTIFLLLVNAVINDLSSERSVQPHQIQIYHACHDKNPSRSRPNPPTYREETHSYILLEPSMRSERSLTTLVIRSPASNCR
jgi:hypothetical protein